jgi:hypothetical protein
LRGSVCPGATLDYVPRGWVRESWVVHDAHLFVLQIHASNFETSWWGEMVWLREAFHRLGIQDSRMSQSLILIDALSSACWEKRKRKKKRERETVRGLFF